MSVGSETANTFSEMRNILTDSDWDGAAAPLIGGEIGLATGVAFMIAVEGVGQGSPFRVAALHDQIHGLKQARSELAGQNPVLAARRENINQAIAHKRIEIRQATPDHPSFVQSATEVVGPLAGGAALGIFAGAALAARLRIRRQRNSSPSPATT